MVELWIAFGGFMFALVGQFSLIWYKLGKIEGRLNDLTHPKKEEKE